MAGLQAIATARRLGGVVQAYDLRPAVKGEVQSLGAKFLEIEAKIRAAVKAGKMSREDAGKKLVEARKRIFEGGR